MKNTIRGILLLMALCLITGCGGAGKQTANKKEMETGFVPARPGMYDSADTAVIVSINQTAGEMVFYNTIVKRNYTLSYDGTCRVTDKYGESVSMDQLKSGEIVDILFLKEKKQLASVQRSSEAFSHDNISRYAIDEKHKEITIGSDIYQFKDELLIFSEGETVELMDINEADKLTISGIGNTIYSIRVEEGHGYLRLKNEEELLNGWLEVGQNIIRKVTEGMLLVVPEGTYEVRISKGSISETREVTIKRDKETELDLGGIKKEEEKTFGNLLFSVLPETAQVYIDGEAVDISVPLQVEYGIHQMMAKADGYQTVIQYIKVGQENATIQVTLEKQTEQSVSSNTVDETVSSDTATTTSGGTLTIAAPVGAELYMDGSYVGIIPASVKKTAGVHVIVLRKSGYDTRSYTINITDAESDQSMSFSELTVSEKESEEESEDEDEEEDGENGSASENDL